MSEMEERIAELERDVSALYAGLMLVATCLPDLVRMETAARMERGVLAANHPGMNSPHIKTMLTEVLARLRGQEFDR